MSSPLIPPPLVPLPNSEEIPMFPTTSGVHLHHMSSLPPLIATPPLVTISQFPVDSTLAPQHVNATTTSASPFGYAFHSPCVGQFVRLEQH